MTLQSSAQTGVADLFASSLGKGMGIFRQGPVVFLGHQRPQHRTLILIQEQPEATPMRLGFASSVLMQLAHPTPRRTFGDLKAACDRGNALTPTLASPQNTVA
jgi:hypothetical protein